MRLIDADALQREYMQFHDGKRSVLVDVAPTIEPERKKGKWIPHYDAEDYPLGCRCSVCNETYVMPDGWANFCPNCGADMRGEEECG